MEDDKLKSLFTNFEPELSSDFKFMNKLERNLNSVEIIKRHTAEVRSRNKKAVAIAAFAGFIVGFCVFSVFTLSQQCCFRLAVNTARRLYHESFCR